MSDIFVSPLAQATLREYAPERELPHVRLTDEEDNARVFVYSPDLLDQLEDVVRLVASRLAYKRETAPDVPTLRGVAGIECTINEVDTLRGVLDVIKAHPRPHPRPDEARPAIHGQ